MDGLLERREMSKFATEADEFVWDISLDGGIEEHGSVDEGGWYGRIEFRSKDIACLVPMMGIEVRYAIISEDDQGFVSVDYFLDRTSCDFAWKAIIRG